MPHSIRLLMPRFFFHIEDGHCAPDEEGTELPHSTAAYDEAIRMTGAILHEQGLEALGDRAAWRLRVCEGKEGPTVFTLNFAAIKEEA